MVLNLFKYMAHLEKKNRVRGTPIVQFLESSNCCTYTEQKYKYLKNSI